MKLQTFMKGLGMALMAVVITYFSTTPVDYVMMGVAAVSTMLVYCGKNIITFLHSDSPLWTLSVVNALSGIFVAIGTALTQSVATFLIEGAIAWDIVWRLTLSVTLTYLAGTLVAHPHVEKVKKQ